MKKKQQEVLENFIESFEYVDRDINSVTFAPIAIFELKINHEHLQDLMAFIKDDKDKAIVFDALLDRLRSFGNLS